MCDGVADDDVVSILETHLRKEVSVGVSLVRTREYEIIYSLYHSHDCRCLVRVHEAVPCSSS